MDSGANVDAENRFGRSALDFARSLGRMEIVFFLENLGAKDNITEGLRTAEEPPPPLPPRKGRAAAGNSVESLISRLETLPAGCRDSLESCPVEEPGYRNIHKAEKKPKARSGRERRQGVLGIPKEWK